MTIENLEPKQYLASKSHTKTSAFLLPTIGVKVNMLRQHRFVNAFTKDIYREDLNQDYKMFCLFSFHIDDIDFQIFIDHLVDTSSYVTHYPAEYGGTMFVFQIPEKWHEVYDRFINGEYSKIPKEYVKRYFKPRLFIGVDEYQSQVWKLSKNWLILNRSKAIVEQIEKDLNVTLAPDAEVFSKPNKLEHYGETDGGYSFF